MSYYDAYDMRHLRHQLDEVMAAQTADMMFPVRCTWCSGIYDVGKVEVTARYTDCSMWKAPCCGQHVFDAALVAVIDPYWWHDEVPETWRIPSGEFPIHAKALSIEEEAS